MNLGVPHQHDFSMKPFLVALFFALTLAGCRSKTESDAPVASTSSAQPQAAPPIVRVAAKDPQMEKAIADARQSVGKFIVALQSPTAKQSGFSVKKPFKTAQGVEHIWLSEVSFDGQKFKGRVANAPARVKGVKLGDAATVGKNEISDWYYLDSGKLIGGQSIRLLYSRLPPRAQKIFDAQAGFRLK